MTLRAALFLLAWPVVAAAQETHSVTLAQDISSVGLVSTGISAAGGFVVVQEGDSFQASGWAVRARRLDADGQPLGTPFTVNSSSFNDRYGARVRPSVAADAGGAFTVVWSSQGFSSGGINGVRARRFDASGTPLGDEFAVSPPAAHGIDPAIAMTPSGRSLIVWAGADDGSGTGIGGQVLDAGGNLEGVAFRVNGYTTDTQLAPAVAATDDGLFVAAWQSRGQDGDQEGVFGQRFDGTGTPLGGEFQVNTSTGGIQAFPAVATLDDGGFVVGWMAADGVDGAGPGIFARRYQADGTPLGSEFRVGASAIRLHAHALSLARDARNGFAIGWTDGIWHNYLRRYEADGTPVAEALVTTFSFGQVRGAFTLMSDAQRSLAVLRGDTYFLTKLTFYGALWPAALEVDVAETGGSDRNGVLDPGEVVFVRPAWHNHGPDEATATGSLTSFTGPGAPVNPAYVVVNGSASYASIPPGSDATCSPASNCYAVGVTVPSSRPVLHLDALLAEKLVGSGADESRTWRVHVGGSFSDVPRTSPDYRFAETLLHFEVSDGCGGGAFCPAAPVTREQFPVLLLAARYANRSVLRYGGPGTHYQPPQPARGVFNDVPPSSPYAPWIEDLAERGIVAGCAPNRYCPRRSITRAEIAVMLLGGVEGGSYAPPACTVPMFDDVPCTNPYARWVNELAARGIVTGCAPRLYCPTGLVNRGQAAGLLTRAFALDLYAPADLSPILE